MQQHRFILEAAARESLPTEVDESTDPPFNLVRELVEAGMITAIDASTHDGFAYLNPRITLAGREYLQRLQASAFAGAQVLVQSLERLRNILVAVSTGGPRIEETNDDYRELYRQVARGLDDLGVNNSIPFADLWDWYGRWRSGDLPSYQSRRQFVAEMVNPVLAQVRDHAAGRAPRQIELTGWPKVDRALGEVRRRLADAGAEEQFQAVGLLCREVLISLAQAVYDPKAHATADGVVPSSTDAKRMLEAYIGATMSGSSYEVTRKHARASFDLANDLQHRRTASFREAALCVEATASVVNVIAIISGRRDPG